VDWPAARIDLIPHGIPDLPFVDPNHGPKLLPATLV
jgi:hypothetical protein